MMVTVATKDVTDEQVVRAAAAWRAGGDCTITGVMTTANAPYKVALRAIERACRRGLVDWGVCPDCAWPTQQGEELLAGAALHDA